MISARAHWRNAPQGCRYKQQVETKYLNALLDQVDGDVRLLKQVWDEARRSPHPDNSFSKFDAIATTNATQTLMVSERRAAITLEFLDLDSKH